MFEKPELQRLTVDDLAKHCAAETNSYFQHGSYDPGYCLELFRRAIRDRDERALEVILLQYTPLVEKWVDKWISTHPDFSQFQEEEQDFVAQAFERFWRSFTPAKLEKSQSLAAVLRYLQLCVSGVLTDQWRLARHQMYEDLETGEAAQSFVDELSVIESANLWERISAYLHDEKERQIIYGSYFQEMNPRELIAAYPGSFRDIEEIYRIKQNVLARLRREGFRVDEEPVITEHFGSSSGQLREAFGLSNPHVAARSTRIVLTLDGEPGLSTPQLTPEYLLTVVGPYLKAISDLQQILDEMLERAPGKVHIQSITQHSPISVSLDGAGEAVEAIKNTVVPWRRRHLEQLAHLALTEKQVEIEIKRAEVLERRARAEKDRQEAERLSAEATLKRAEADRIKMENEKLHQELHSAKIKLALEVMERLTPDLSDEQRLMYTTRLLEPLSILVGTEIQISGS